jgi:hypothetical protein
MPGIAVAFLLQDDLVMMVLDVTEEQHGRFNVWGVTPCGASVLVRVQDYFPYFYIAAPWELVLSGSLTRLPKSSTSVCLTNPFESGYRGQGTSACLSAAPIVFRQSLPRFVSCS